MNSPSFEDLIAEAEARAKSIDLSKPVVDHNEEGDLLEFLVRPCGYWGRRLDERMTLLFDLETDDLVGFQLKKFSQILEDDWFKASLTVTHDTKVVMVIEILRTWHLTRAKPQEAATDSEVLPQLREIVGETKIPLGV